MSAEAGTSMDHQEPDERVVLVDQAGAPIGTAAKREVHHEDTPLHLAFSCYVFDADGALLVTRRSDEKRTWPGVWTNSLCGHPQPEEGLVSAVRRRANEELGLDLQDVRLALPGFRYRAVMPNGIVEHEICPVLTAVTRDTPNPAPGETAAAEWVPWEVFRNAVLTGRQDVSPWCDEQVALLSIHADHPRELEADVAALPTAARW